MKINEECIKIKGFIEYVQNNQRKKEVVYKIEGDIVLHTLEIDAEKEYTEDELKKLICEVMQNEQ